MQLKHALAITSAVLLTACADKLPTQSPEPLPARSTVAATTEIIVNEVMADPSAVTDDMGEWFEVHNYGGSSVDLQGWTIASNNDAAHTIATSVSVPAGGYVVLAINSNKRKNGGVTAGYQYVGINLANSADWIALRDNTGATVDSVAWTSMPSGASRGVLTPQNDNTSVGGSNWQTQTSTFGKGDKGTPAAQNNGYAPPPGEITIVTVSPDSTNVAVAGQTAFSATARDANGATVTTTFTWSSSNTAVASVDNNGTVTGVATGTAQIRATAPNGVFDEAKITVTTSGGGGVASLQVHILDVGQGDAQYITNGASRVIIDGGPDTTAFRQHLDALGLSNTTIDVVILSHEHFDHHSGLRELFKKSRNLTIRYFFENKNTYSNAALQQLRDSINARASRGELIYRDSDNPCGNNSAICTFVLDGGAKLHIMKPNPNGTSPNDRSTPVKLVGADSASFSMWFAGDAEHEAIGWFDTTNYDLAPGMNVDVLKADHHGSCNGITNRYADLLSPSWVTFGVGGSNTYGHVHQQTKDLFNARGISWWRTDLNGTITITAPGTPGSGYSFNVQRGNANLSGSTDKTSAQSQCNPLP